jgi:hypothetical protein
LFKLKFSIKNKKNKITKMKNIFDGRNKKNPSEIIGRVCLFGFG